MTLDLCNTMGGLTWDVLCLIAIVAVSKSRHRLFFYLRKEMVKRTGKTFEIIFLSSGGRL